MDCPNIKQKEIQSRLIDVYWDFASLSNLKFDADLQIDGLDRTNLLNDIITVLGQMKINILNIHADASDDGRALIKLKIGVDDAEHLNRAHIGEVQASIWPQEMIDECEKNNIHLL